jgi:predicted enzyme related to lactoylglutathione lyase
MAAPKSEEKNVPAERDAAAPKPALHHILIEVRDIATSLKFYRDCLGLSLTSQSGDFATLESANSGVYLWEKRWGFEKPLAKGERSGVGIYPHFEIPDVAAAVERFKKAGYEIVQAPKSYGWGTEAFVKDSDGYVIALVSMMNATHAKGEGQE